METVTPLSSEFLKLSSNFFFLLRSWEGYNSEKWQRAIVLLLNLSFVSFQDDSARQSQEGDTQCHLAKENS